jgi:hypothetical protein
LEKAKVKGNFEFQRETDPVLADFSQTMHLTSADRIKEKMSNVRSVTKIFPYASYLFNFAQLNPFQ